MDLVFEYEHAFGPLDPKRTSWAKFLAGVMRTVQFTARELYAAIVGPSVALSALSSENTGETMQLRHNLAELAFGAMPQRQKPLIIGPDEI